MMTMIMMMMMMMMWMMRVAVELLRIYASFKVVCRDLPQHIHITIFFVIK